MTKQFKNAIWDFDGTLYDTYPVMVTSLRVALLDQNVTIDRDELLLLIKKRSINFATGYFSQVYGIDPKKLSTEYHRIEHEHQTNPQPFPNCALVLRSVIERGGQNFLLTHRDEQSDAFLEHDGLLKYFTDSVTTKNNFPRKPDPTSILYLMDKYQLDPKETVMVGDRPLDVQTGINGHCLSAYFDVDGFHQAPEADFQLLDLKDILAYLN